MKTWENYLEEATSSPRGAFASLGYLQKQIKIRESGAKKIEDLEAEEQRIIEHFKIIPKTFDAYVELANNLEKYVNFEACVVRDMDDSRMNMQKAMEAAIESLIPQQDGKQFFDLLAKSTGRTGKINRNKFGSHPAFELCHRRGGDPEEDWHKVLKERNDKMDATTDQNEKQKIAEKYHEPLNLLYIKGRAYRDILWRLSVVSDYEYTQKEIERIHKKIAAWETKIDNANAAFQGSYNELEPCLKELREKWSDVLFKAEMSRKNEAEQLLAKYGSEHAMMDALCADYQKNPKTAVSPMMIVMYLHKTEAQLKKSCEEGAMALVVEMDIRVAQYKSGYIVAVAKDRIGPTGSLNCNVKSESGKWFGIKTIVAGGYNIQRLHYRVIVGNPE